MTKYEELLDFAKSVEPCGGCVFASYDGGCDNYECHWHELLRVAAELLEEKIQEEK